MNRQYLLAAAQLGPIARNEPRTAVVQRLIELMHDAHKHGAKVVVYPELALTTFFPRWFIEDVHQLNAFYETTMPGMHTQCLFDTAVQLGMSFHLGYAELVHDQTGKLRRFNTSILVSAEGEIVGKYRKVHLPGHFEHEPWRPFQHLEKRYFEHGDLGFPVFNTFGGVMGMCICNDRRWPETFRVLGLRGAELVMLGYNTPVHYPPAPQHDHLQDFHNHLCMQAGAYQNGNWVVGVAKAGHEEGCDLIGGTCIIAPTGEIVSQAKSTADELIMAEIDLDRCAELRQNIFNFSLHREPEDYAAICAPKK